MTDWRRAVREALGAGTGDPARDEEIAEELGDHLAQRHAELLASGMVPNVAEQTIMTELDAASLAARLRRSLPRAHPAPQPPPTSQRPRVLRDLGQDLRYALRLLRRSPGFTIATVTTLALGIGATTAIFSVLDSVLLRPAPFDDPERVMMVWETDRVSGTLREPASFPDLVDFQQRSRQFGAFAGFGGFEANLTPKEGDPVRLAALATTGDLPRVLGVRLLAGRSFSVEENQPGGPSVAMISETLWEREYARANDVAGRTIRLDERDVTIVGVVPREADFGVLQILGRAAYGRSFADRDVRSRVDVWVPLQPSADQFPRSTHPIIVVGRLTSGATPALAQQELEGIMRDLEAAHPENRARGAFIEPITDVVFGRVRPALLVLFGAVGLVLLVACVNVANLLLARGTARAREVAVRTALGAVTQRLARQFAVENLVLTLFSAALGLVLAVVALRALLVLAPADIPRLDAVGLDARVLGVALTLAIGTGLLFGLVPIFQAGRLDVQRALRAEESRGATSGRERGLIRSTLVVTQIAFSVILVLGAGLLIKSFWRLQRVDPGFAAAGVLKVEFQLPASRYPTPMREWPNFPAQHRFNEGIVRRVAALPGVTSVAVAGNHPLDAGFTNSFTIVGREAESRDWPEISIRRVSPAYFTTVRVPLRDGRLFASGDAATAAPVAVLNEAAAARFFGDANPVGARISFWGSAREIVGVVGDERIHGVAEGVPSAVYVPLAQVPSIDGAHVLLVHTTGDPEALSSSVRAAFRELDPQLAIFGIEPLTRTLATSIGQQRFLMLLLAIFAGLALVLAAIGVHGVLSYTVSQRRQELGIRMALGASPGAVMRLVLAQGGRLASLGLVLGLAGALASTRLLANLLHGVSPRDAVIFAAALPLLAVVALAAAWLPARRAVRMGPMEAIRDA